MFYKVNTFGLSGLSANPVTVEIGFADGGKRAKDTGKGQSLEIIGLGDSAIKESRVRIYMAMSNIGIAAPDRGIVINLSPASVKKYGSIFDLAMYTALTGLCGIHDFDVSECAFIGELSLSGEVRPVQGALSVALAARDRGVKRLFIAEENAREASAAGISVYGITNLAEFTELLVSGVLPTPAPPYIPAPADYTAMPDFADVKGQPAAKRALEIAAAGFHNVLMSGSPGTGKSMLSKRLPSILPVMTFEESIEATRVHSAAGLVNPLKPLLVNRPFRPVSHTASAAGIVGGGSNPAPGEISLAHCGVLFLDELPEFSRNALESLRQPLEDGQVTISRASATVTFPCRVMFIAAMNPCPCGNYGSPVKPCCCTPKQVRGYLGKISGALLDRIDIQIEMTPVSYETLTEAPRPEESSAAIRERVCEARERQRLRFEDAYGKAVPSVTNSQIQPNQISTLCRLEAGAEDILRKAVNLQGFSPRSRDRVLKVARTVADLDGSYNITAKAVAEALRCRKFDGR